MPRVDDRARIAKTIYKQEDVIMERALMALSAIALIAGFVLFSDVVMISALVFALWSRIAQANRQHQEALIAASKK